MSEITLAAGAVAPMPAEVANPRRALSSELQRAIVEAANGRIQAIRRRNLITTRTNNLLAIPPGADPKLAAFAPIEQQGAGGGAALNIAEDVVFQC